MEGWRGRGSLGPRLDGAPSPQANRGERKGVKRKRKKKREFAQGRCRTNGREEQVLQVRPREYTFCTWYKCVAATWPLRGLRSQLSSFPLSCQARAQGQRKGKKEKTEEGESVTKKQRKMVPFCTHPHQEVL